MPCQSIYMPCSRTSKQGSDNVIMMTSSSSNDRPPPPPPGAAKIRRTDAVSLFDAGSPFAEAVLMQEQASPAQDAAALVRERSPPWGDRRPLSKRNKSHEDREAARGAEDTYGQLRAKALSARSKTVPAEVFIGECPSGRERCRPTRALCREEPRAPQPLSGKRLRRPRTGASERAEGRRTPSAPRFGRRWPRTRTCTRTKWATSSRGAPRRSRRTPRRRRRARPYRPSPALLGRRTATACADARGGKSLGASRSRERVGLVA